MKYSHVIFSLKNPKQKEAKIDEANENENENSKANGNIVPDVSGSPDSRKMMINNNNNNINNNKNLNNNNVNDNEPKNGLPLKNGSLSKNDRFRFGSSKTLSREEDRILKEMVSERNTSTSTCFVDALNCCSISILFNLTILFKSNLLLICRVFHLQRQRR